MLPATRYLRFLTFYFWFFSDETTLILFDNSVLQSFYFCKILLDFLSSSTTLIIPASFISNMPGITVQMLFQNRISQFPKIELNISVYRNQFYNNDISSTSVNLIRSFKLYSYAQPLLSPARALLHLRQSITLSNSYITLQRTKSILLCILEIIFILYTKTIQIQLNNLNHFQQHISESYVYYFKVNLFK